MTTEPDPIGYPPTVIVVHHRERRGKCTVEPLRGRADIRFLKFPSQTVPELPGYVRLSLDGPPLGPADADAGLLVLDATWRLVTRMQDSYRDVPTRSLPTAMTAYPRASKLIADPSDGLATIEAIYLAYKMLGRPVEGLLDQYHWRDLFLERNGFT